MDHEDGTSGVGVERSRLPYVPCGGKDNWMGVKGPEIKRLHNNNNILL